MFELTWIDFVILILASFRLTHLIVFDEIASFIRTPFLEVKEQQDSGGNKEVIIEIKGKGLRFFIGSLLSCYWCVGFWISLVVVIVFFSFPIVYPVLIVLAVAGAASVIESKV